MQVHDKLYIGGDWVASDGGGTIEVISPHTEEVIGDRARRHRRRHRHAPSPPPAAPSTTADWPRMDRPASARDRGQRFTRPLAARAEDMAATSSPRRWARPSRSRQLAQSPAPWMVLDYFASLAKDFAFEEERKGVLGPRSSCAASRSASSPPSSRGTSRCSSRCSKLAPALVVGLHDGPEARARDAARRVPAGRAAARRPACPRASSTSSPPVARSASTSSATPASTRSPSPARPPPAAAHRLHLRRAAQALHASSSAASRRRSSSTTPTSTPTIDGLLKFAGADEQRPGLRGPDPHPRQPRQATTRSSTPWPTRVRGHEGRRPGRDPATEVGPLVAERQQERVEKYIALGQEEGARVVVGGRPPGRPGQGLVRRAHASSPTSPTTCASPRRRSSGRSSSVIPFDDVDDAVRIANDSDYGLAGLGVDRRRRRRHGHRPAGSAPAPSASTSS